MSSVLPSNFDPDAEPTADGIYGLPTAPGEAALVLMPVPWEATVSFRGGTSRAPHAIMAASRQVELFDVEMGRPFEQGIAMLPPNAELERLHEVALTSRESGEPAQLDQACERMAEIVENDTRAYRARGKIVGVIGGEHSVCVGAIKALAHECDQLSILQIDAHADLRESYQGLAWSHACTAARILRLVPNTSRLVQVGVRDVCPAEVERIASDARIETFFDSGLSASAEGEAALCDVVDALTECVWVSCDIDGLDPSLCPNTGTPVPGGLTWRELTGLLRQLVQSGRQVVGFDVCEVSPGTDDSNEKDSWDAVVGARVIHKLCGWALATREVARR